MEWIPPMEPVSSDNIPEGPEWTYQIKWDGIRGLTYYRKNTENYSLRVFTKKGRERTAFYPELHQVHELFDGKSAVLDGEMIVLEQDGRPSFHLSLMRERVSDQGRLSYYTRNYPVLYMVFDLLYYDGHLLTNLPLKERKKILYDCLKPEGNIALVEDYREGSPLFGLMKRKNWEGIVSKRLTSFYITGKSHREWLKHKAMKKILAVVCGLQWKEGTPNSLIMGIKQEENWIHIGKASTGLSQNDWRQLESFSMKQETMPCPFNQDDQWKGKPVTWLMPNLTCWVRFLEWTRDGVMRHPVILGFSDLSVEEADGKEWSVDK